MQAAMDRVMQAYGLMVTLSPEDEADARELVQQHLATLQGDENSLAIEGLRFLREMRGRREGIAYLILDFRASTTGANHARDRAARSQANAAIDLLVDDATLQRVLQWLC